MSHGGLKCEGHSGIGQNTFSAEPDGKKPSAAATGLGFVGADEFLLSIRCSHMGLKNFGITEADSVGRAASKIPPSRFKVNDSIASHLSIRIQLPSAQKITSHVHKQSG